jgi:hypothetical protein
VVSKAEGTARRLKRGFYLLRRWARADDVGNKRGSSRDRVGAL